MKTLHLAFLRLQIMALQATAQGQQDVMPMIRCRETHGRVLLAHMNTLTEIERLKAEYRRLSRGEGIHRVAFGG